jgi:hypothetical protein
MFGLLLTACGQPTGNGKVIGVRPIPSPGPISTFLDPASVDAALTLQLSEADSAQAIPGGSPGINGELPIDTQLTLRQLESLITLQQLGTVIIQTRLADIAKVRNEVMIDRLTNSYQKYLITSRLDSTAAGLHAAQVKLAKDVVVDQARLDITAVGAFRIHGLILPQAHELIAAYDLVQLAGIYGNERASLQNRIYTSGITGAAAVAAQNAVDDLSRQVSSLNSSGSYAAYLLQGLTVAGFPGNKGGLLRARQLVAGAKGANDKASIDAAQARAALGI